MKRLVAICVVVMISLMMTQQSSAKQFGVKAGVNLTNMDFQSGIPATLGYQAGLTWLWQLPLGFAIQPDLLYHVKATRLSEINGNTFGLGYIEVPVNLQWGLRFADRNVRLFAQASPFVGYAVAQTGDVTSLRTGNETADEMLASTGVDKWANINRFSYGAGLGLGVQLWALQVTAQYNWNLGKLADISDVKWEDFNDSHFSGCTISIALMFGGKKKNNND